MQNLRVYILNFFYFYLLKLKEEDEIQLKIQLLDRVKRDKIWQQNTPTLFRHEGYKVRHFLY